MDVSIIIVNYNTLQLTKNCITSIIKHTEGVLYEIILVDNASSDNSSKYFAGLKGITFISSSENLGFGKANNLGAELATGEFLFFLNSDTLLTENSIKILTDFFNENQYKLKVGALGCILVDKEGNYNGSGNDLPVCRTEIEIYKSLIPVIKVFFQKPQPFTIPQGKEFFEIGYVIGADLLMKRKVFEQLGGFDPDYFMYYEESDLQKRMRDLGLKAWIYAETKLIHLEDGTGKSLKKYSNRKRTIVHKSRNIYLKKNDPSHFGRYKFWDNIYLSFAKHNPSYSSTENREYYDEIKKTHK